MSALAETLYRHEALPYAGHDEFVELAAGFLAAGVRADEPGVLITRRPRLRDVRDALGPDADQVRFVDVDVDGPNPALMFSVLHEFVADHAGRRVRGLGDSVHEARTSPALAEVELHELLLGTPACRDWNLWLGCSYNTEVLDEDQLAAMLASHPTDGRDLSADAAECFRQPLPPRPADAQTFPIDARDLSSIRAVVRTAAVMSGLSEDRVDGFVCAVNEVVTNSVRHGRGPAEFALWSADDSLVCEVHDRGQIRDPLAGRLPPPLGRTSGRGLWLANHLCDLVQVRGPVSGTSVRLHIS